MYRIKKTLICILMSYTFAFIRLKSRQKILTVRIRTSVIRIASLRKEFNFPTKTSI